MADEDPPATFLSLARTTHPALRADVEAGGPPFTEELFRAWMAPEREEQARPEPPRAPSFDWLGLLYWTQVTYGEWSPEWWDVWWCTSAMLTPLSRFERVLRVAEAWEAAGRPEVRPGMKREASDGA